MVLVDQQLDSSIESSMNNPKVKCKVCISNVKRVPLKSLLKLFVIGYGTVEAFGLRQTGYAGLHKRPELVVFDKPGKFITICVHMRPGAYHTHLAQKNIKELWQFINIVHS